MPTVALREKKLIYLSEADNGTAGVPTQRKRKNGKKPEPATPSSEALHVDNVRPIFSPFISLLSQ